MWFTRFDWTNVGLLYYLGILLIAYRRVCNVSRISYLLQSYIGYEIMYFGWTLLLKCLASCMLDVVYCANS